MENLNEEIKDLTIFCCRCLADSRTGGSWKGGVVDGYCMNCGAADSTVNLPFWAVEAIRKTASWVCKRYYPDDEDFQIQRELKALRAVAPMPDDEVEAGETPGQWTVWRKFSKFRTGLTVRAKDEAEARRLAHLELPFVE